MLIITRTVHFCAAHRLYNNSWSEEKNREVYGKCSNPGGHGHNYTLKVSVTGEIDKENGMVINVTDLRDVLSREIINKLDHRDLNNDIDFFAGQVTTMENMVQIIAKRLETPLKALGVRLVKLELNESEKNSVTMEIS